MAGGPLARGKVIAAINLTIDGFCDHTLMNPDGEVHDHYTELLKGGDYILYGRVTYQLMEFWKDILEKPTGEAFMNDFARAMDRIPKIVFSRTLTHLDWPSARLAKAPLEEEVLELRKEAGARIYVGSPGLIVALSNLDLIDEYQLCVHPSLVGSGKPLFKDLGHRLDLRLTGTKVFGSGAIVLHYERGGAAS
jgi:dihydrofolate reductase